MTISTDGVSFGGGNRGVVATSHQLAPSPYAMFGAPDVGLPMTMGDEGRLRARREAALHVQLELTNVPARCPDSVVSIRGRIVAVFRGQELAAPGTYVEFPIWVCSPDKEPTGPACVYFDSLIAATYIELFLYGTPPDCKLAAYEYEFIDTPSATPVLSATDLGTSTGTRDSAGRRWWQLW